MATEMQQTDVQTIMVPLDGFTRLDAKVDGIEVVKHGKLGIRPLNKSHVNHLAHSDYRQWPNLEAALKDGKVILYDGYHRLEGASLIGNLNEHIEGEEDVNGEMVTALPVNVRTFANDTDIVKAALLANMKHGLAANELSRTRLGILLLHNMVEHHEKPRFTEAAKEVGISKVTLWEAWQKEMQPEESEEGEEDGKASREKAEKAIASFAKSMRSFMKGIKAIESDSEVSSMLASTLTEEDDKDTVTSVVNILKEAMKGIKKPTAKKPTAKKPVATKLEQPTLITEAATPEAATPEAATPEAATVKKSVTKKSKTSTHPEEATEHAVIDSGDGTEVEMI